MQRAFLRLITRISRHRFLCRSQLSMMQDSEPVRGASVQRIRLKPSMNNQQIEVLRLENGLTCLFEPMQGVQSAAFSILTPAGSAYDPANGNGTSAIMTEMLTRGAGSRDSRTLSLDLDNLGVQRSEGASTQSVSLSGATLGKNLEQTLRIYRDILLEPHLSNEEFAAARALTEQNLLSVEDEPRQKVIVELRRRTYQSSWGLPSDGTLDHLQNITIDSVGEHFRNCIRPNGTIIGISGCIDVAQMAALIQELFGEWARADDKQATEIGTEPLPNHLNHESTQTHIGIAYKAVPYKHEQYYAAWAAVSILSGGMSSRLFTKVREERGLCYAISASLNSLREEARVLGYAGTTSERAQETLDVTLHELKAVGLNITNNELDRCKARAKSSLVMQQESTMSRAGSIARDWLHLGRVTTLDEVRQKVDALTIEDVQQYAEQYPADDFDIVTIGPEPLQFPE